MRGRKYELLENESVMKAAVLHGKEDVRIESVAPGQLQPGEVRILIEAALTCGTDLKVYRRGYHARMIVPPAVFGHELAGVISEVRAPAAAEKSPGHEAHAWRPGDRVVVANSAPCGVCFHCRKGQQNLCDDLLFLNGAYAESIVVPARLAQKNLLRLKAGTEFQDAALTEPLACVVQGIEDIQPAAGDHVLVLGAGPIGLMFVALLKHRGCAVTLVGRGEERLARARHLGADTVLDAAGHGKIDALIPRGVMFDVVVEAIGKPETWEAAVRLVRKGGTVNFFGGCPTGTTVTLDTGLLHYSSLKLLASFHHTPRTVRQALEFIEKGVVQASDFVDGVCPLSQLPQLFQSMAAGNRAVKTLIRVHE